MFNKEELDNLVQEILLECADFIPPLAADEITRHVMHEINTNAAAAIRASLARLVEAGALSADRTGGFRTTTRYSVPHKAAAYAHPLI